MAGALRNGLLSTVGDDPARPVEKLMEAATWTLGGAAPSFRSNRCAARLAGLGGLVAAWAVFALSVDAPSAHAAAASAPSVILDGVTIVNTRDGGLRRGMAIQLRGGKITKIAPAHSLRATGSTVLVKATGKFVVPGFNDMHNHALNSPGPDVNLPLMLANGITGFRQMAGSPELLEQRRTGKLPNVAAAPELLAMPGAIFVGPPFFDPQRAAAAVDAQKAQGADFIKVIDIPPPAFFAMLDKARADGLPVAGHLPPTIDVREAARRGMKAVEHLGPNASILEACSIDEAAIREQLAKRPPGPPRIPFGGSPGEVQRAVANPMLLMGPEGPGQLQHVLDTYSDAKCRSVARETKDAGMWQVPTMIRLKAMDLGDDPAFVNDPNLRFVVANDREIWSDVGKAFSAKMSPESRTTLKNLFARQMALVKLFDDEGVKMMVGTDFGGQWIVAGFSIHQEFDLLAQAKISPLHVLQMTTLNPAEFLGREATMGAVEVGKDANLVLLDANPIATSQNLHKINAVVRGGTYYSRAALDEIKRKAARAR